MIQTIVIELLATLAIVCGLAPIPEAWEPDPADVDALARTLYGECRGCSELQQRAVAWTIFNRVDNSDFPNSLIEVVSQPYQFAGYSESFPVTDELEAMARDCLIDWHNGEGRVLGPEYLYFTGNGRINIFTTEYGGKGERWAEE